MLEAQVFSLPISGPEDVSALENLLESGQIMAEDIVAVLGKTEGNGCVNDFTRGYCTLAYKLLLSKHLKMSCEDVEKKVAFVMSGGTEGVLSPHVTIFTQSKREGAPAAEKALSLGVGFTRDFLPEEIGTMAQLKEVARVVTEAMKEACIDDPADVHFVQIKCPLLTSDRINEAAGRKKETVTQDTYKSMGYSRAASALGIALAMGEVQESDLDNAKICSDWNLYSAVASTSAGVELRNCEIILMGNSKQSASAFRIGHSVMENSIDIQAVLDAMRNAGLTFSGLPDKQQTHQVVNVFAKAEADPRGIVLGRRNTMLTDSDFNHTRHARAVVGGVVASVVQDPMVYISGGAEHQGPAGGGPVAVILKR